MMKIIIIRILEFRKTFTPALPRTVSQFSQFWKHTDVSNNFISTVFPATVLLLSLSETNLQFEMLNFEKQQSRFPKTEFGTCVDFSTTQNWKHEFWKVVLVLYTRFPIFDIIIFHRDEFLFSLCIHHVFLPCMHTW